MVLESTSDRTLTGLFDGPALQVTKFRFGSQSMMATEAPRRASVVATASDKVDLPTPPFELATVMIATTSSILWTTERNSPREVLPNCKRMKVARSLGR